MLPPPHPSISPLLINVDQTSIKLCSSINRSNAALSHVEISTKFAPTEIAVAHSFAYFNNHLWEDHIITSFIHFPAGKITLDQYWNHISHYWSSVFEGWNVLLSMMEQCQVFWGRTPSLYVIRSLWGNWFHASTLLESLALCLLRQSSPTRQVQIIKNCLFFLCVPYILGAWSPY